MATSSRRTVEPITLTVDSFIRADNSFIGTVDSFTRADKSDIGTTFSDIGTDKSFICAGKSSSRGSFLQNGPKRTKSWVEGAFACGTNGNWSLTATLTVGP